MNNALATSVALGGAAKLELDSQTSPTSAAAVELIARPRRRGAAKAALLDRGLTIGDVPRLLGMRLRRAANRKRQETGSAVVFHAGLDARLNSVARAAPFSGVTLHFLYGQLLTLVFLAT